MAPENLKAEIEGQIDDNAINTGYKLNMFDFYFYNFLVGILVM